jgi:hypothetical protein
MCRGCWEEYGECVIDSPSIRAAAAAMDAVYEFHCAGGNLHIVLDDWNLEDESLEFCRKEISGGGYWNPNAPLDGTPTRLAGATCCRAAVLRAAVSNDRN